MSEAVIVSGRIESDITIESDRLNKLARLQEIIRNAKLEIATLGNLSEGEKQLYYSRLDVAANGFAAVSVETIIANVRNEAGQENQEKQYEEAENNVRQTTYILSASQHKIIHIRSKRIDLGDEQGLREFAETYDQPEQVIKALKDNPKLVEEFNKVPEIQRRQDATNGLVSEEQIKDLLKKPIPDALREQLNRVNKYHLFRDKKVHGIISELVDDKDSHFSEQQIKRLQLSIDKVIETAKVDPAENPAVIDLKLTVNNYYASLMKSHGIAEKFELGSINNTANLGVSRPRTDEERAQFLANQILESNKNSGLNKNELLEATRKKIQELDANPVKSEDPIDYAMRLGYRDMIAGRYDHAKQQARQVADLMRKSGNYSEASIKAYEKLLLDGADAAQVPGGTVYLQYLGEDGAVKQMAEDFKSLCAGKPTSYLASAIQTAASASKSVFGLFSSNVSDQDQAYNAAKNKLGISEKDDMPGLIKKINTLGIKGADKDGDGKISKQELIDAAQNYVPSKVPVAAAAPASGRMGHN